MRRLVLAAGILLMTAAGARAQTLPDAIAAKHKITVALFASFPPMAYKQPDDNKLVGIDVDLAAYFAEKLHIDIEWQETSYETATNALETGRVDMAFSLLDLPEPATRLDFIDYLTSGMQVYTLSSRAADIPTLLDLCGKTIGANRRNGFDASMRQWSDKTCLPAGRPALEILATEGTPSARLQLRQGRVDAAVQSSESVPYTMGLEPGVYTKVGAPLTALMIGMAFPKSDPQLRDVIAATLKQAIADGSYTAILAKHGLQDNSIIAGK
ncbi:MAG TPA: ABC transporter substrate-binding protein [Stellaceae bacterium]|nr:ABC transporter substrate-binding protein [Stellaceae bacterium]